jgi:hypothetical protein
VRDERPLDRAENLRGLRGDRRLGRSRHLGGLIPAGRLPRSSRSVTGPPRPHRRRRGLPHEFRIAVMGLDQAAIC